MQEEKIDWEKLGGGQNENWRKDTFGIFASAIFIVERNAQVEN